MSGSLYSRVNREISFDEFMRIVTGNSSCTAKDREDPNIWSDESKQSFRHVYDAIHANHGAVTAERASTVGKSMLAQNADNEW